MHGREYFRLLAIGLLIGTPLLLCTEESRSKESRSNSPASLLAASPQHAAESVSAQPVSTEFGSRFLLPPSVPRQLPNASPLIDFAHLTRASGMIFSGTVTSITPSSTSPNDAIPTIAITFRVDQSLRGTNNAQNLTVHEWMGAWSVGQSYRVGERALVFLYPPSRLGLTSPVARSLGRFRVDAVGRVELSEEQLAAFRNDPLLGANVHPALSDFARAVRRASGEE